MSVHSRYRAGLWHPYEKPMYGVLLNPYHPLARGLVGCWLFNEGGGNIVYDLSGFMNHGTLGGGTAGYCPSWITGKFGSVLSFDGSDDYVDIGDTGQDAYAIELCFCTSTTINPSTSGTTLIQLHYLGGSGQGVIGLGSVTGFLDDEVISLLDRYEGVYTRTGVCNITINPGWHHLVLTYNPNSANYYDFWLDSTKQTTTAGSQGAINRIQPASEVLIGKDKAVDYNFFGDLISFVRIYNRSLNADEIFQLHVDPFCMFYHPLEAELLYAAAPPVGIVPQAMHHYRMLREV